MDVTVVLPSGKTIGYDVAYNTRVLDLKSRIAATLNADAKSIDLLHSGTYLADKDIIEAQNLHAVYKDQNGSGSSGKRRGGSDIESGLGPVLGDNSNGGGRGSGGGGGGKVGYPGYYYNGPPGYYGYGPPAGGGGYSYGYTKGGTYNGPPPPTAPGTGGGGGGGGYSYYGQPGHGSYYSHGSGYGYQAYPSGYGGYYDGGWSACWIIGAIVFVIIVALVIVAVIWWNGDD